MIDVPIALLTLPWRYAAYAAERIAARVEARAYAAAEKVLEDANPANWFMYYYYADGNSTDAGSTPGRGTFRASHTARPALLVFVGGILACAFRK